MTANFTKLPNNYIDLFMSELSDASFKVLMAITRKTIGWNKEVDFISLTQFEQMTGKSRSTVIKALKELMEKQLIKSGKVTRNGTQYSLTGKTNIGLDKDPQKTHNQLAGDGLLEDLDGSKNKLVEILDSTSLKNSPLLVERIDIHKEIKEIKEIEKEKKEMLFLKELKIPRNVDVAIWKLFIQMRIEINNPLTFSSATALLNKLEGYGVNANEILNNAVIGNHSNILEPNKPKCDDSGNNRKRFSNKSTHPRKF